MSFKTISITLPENMIKNIDRMLLESDFASRSDFFRHLVRFWFWTQERPGNKHGAADESAASVREQYDEDVDLEFGIPPHIIREIEIEAKSKI